MQNKLTPPTLGSLVTNWLMPLPAYFTIALGPLASHLASFLLVPPSRILVRVRIGSGFVRVWVRAWVRVQFGSSFVRAPVMAGDCHLLPYRDFWNSVCPAFASEAGGLLRVRSVWGPLAAR